MIECRLEGSMLDVALIDFVCTLAWIRSHLEFASVDQCFDFRSVTITRQLFYRNFVQKLSLCVHESNFFEEAFGKALQRWNLNFLKFYRSGKVTLVQQVQKYAIPKYISDLHRYFYLHAGIFVNRSTVLRFWNSYLDFFVRDWEITNNNFIYIVFIYTGLCDARSSVFS